MTEQCPGCDRPFGVGLACVACWGTVPVPVARAAIDAQCDDRPGVDGLREARRIVRSHFEAARSLPPTSSEAPNQEVH